MKARPAERTVTLLYFRVKRKLSIDYRVGSADRIGYDGMGL